MMGWGWDGRSEYDPQHPLRCWVPVDGSASDYCRDPRTHQYRTG